MRRKLLIGLGVLVLAGGCAAGAFAAYLTHQVEGDYLDAGGVRLHYTVDGAGEPVVLIYGFAANADLNWRKPGLVRMLVRDGYQVISLDARGHGLSEKPYDASKYGAELVEDVVRLLDHLGIDQAHVVGYSMGGFITLKLLGTHPERLRSATLCAAGWLQADEEKVALMAEVVRSLETGGGIKPLLAYLRPGRMPTQWGERVAVNAYVVHLCDQKALAHAFGSLAALEVSEADLRAAAVPVLCVVGSKDPLKAGVEALEGVLPQVEVMVLRGANHGSAIIWPGFRGRLKRFLDKHRRDSGRTAALQTHISALCDVLT